ncbi:hypothetical protein [Polynucleobacter arcticus]|nr:hypothetical protein [Polynucleobacter arcticus]
MPSTSEMQGFQYFIYMDTKDLIHKKYQINDRECFVLRMITQSYLQNQAMRVSDVLRLKEFASPATLHNILKSLIKKKSLSVSTDPKDGRVKYLKPTTMTLNMYREMTGEFIKISTSA